MNDLAVNVKRRTFITAAVCAPAIAVGAVLSRQAQVGAPVLPAADDVPASAGYHETEHIRTYYRSAAF